MAETMMTCKTTEVAGVVERVARRWQGTVLEMVVVPQSDGRATVRIVTPSGIDEPADPGASALEVENADLKLRLSDAENRVAVMKAARDESDAEAQRMREERDVAMVEKVAAQQALQVALARAGS